MRPMQCQQSDMCVGRDRIQLDSTTVSTDNLVSLKEQQFVDLVSQKADELKPPGHKSLPHFSPKSHSCSDQNPRIPQC